MQGKGSIGGRGGSAGQLGKSVGCQHGLGNWMLQRNAGSGESDVSSWSRVLICPLCNCLSLYEDSLLHHLLVHYAHPLGLGDLHSVENVTAAVVELKLIKFSKLKNLFNAYH